MARPLPPDVSLTVSKSSDYIQDEAIRQIHGGSPAGNLRVVEVFHDRRQKTVGSMSDISHSVDGQSHPYRTQIFIHIVRIVKLKCQMKW